MQPLTQIELPFAVGWLPYGFLPPSHVNILYQLALRARSVLEIGSWVGRSTCVIGAALQRRREPVPFHTTDFFIKDDDDWQRRYGVPLSSKINAEVYRQYMRQPGGSRAALGRHLSVRGLDHLVNIYEGDFRDMDFGQRFGLIFCDATHDDREIALNVPTVLRLLEPAGILACHDISTDTLLQALLAQTSFAWYYVHESLFYGQPR